MTPNRERHLSHPMPKRATFEQRVEWHAEHAAACTCREMPPAIRAEVERRRDASAAEEDA